MGPRPRGPSTEVPSEDRRRFCDSLRAGCRWSDSGSSRVPHLWAGFRAGARTRTETSRVPRVPGRRRELTPLPVSSHVSRIAVSGAKEGGWSSPRVMATDASLAAHHRSPSGPAFPGRRPGSRRMVTARDRLRPRGQQIGGMTRRRVTLGPGASSCRAPVQPDRYEPVRSPSSAINEHSMSLDTAPDLS